MGMIIIATSHLGLRQSNSLIRILVKAVKAVISSLKRIIRDLLFSKENRLRKECLSPFFFVAVHIFSILYSCKMEKVTSYQGLTLKKTYCHAIPLALEYCAILVIFFYPFIIFL